MTKSPIKPAIIGYKIDAESRKISQFNYDGSIDSIYEAGGFDCFDVAEFNSKRDTVFVDDNGLGKYRNFFYIEGAHQPFAGNGVVLGGPDAEGETTAPTVTLEWLRANVTFVEFLLPGFVSIEAPSGKCDAADKVMEFFGL